MNIREAPRIEDGQEDQAKATNDSESNSEAGQDLLCDVVVHDQAALVSEVTLHAESGVEEYNHDCRASDEQWLAPCSRSKCRNVHDVLTWVIPRVARVALCRPYTQHGNESAYIALALATLRIHVDNGSIPSHTHPATNGTNQYAKPNILAARNKRVRRRRAKWFGAVYLRPCRNVEGACLPMDGDVSRYAHATAKQRREEQQWMVYSRRKSRRCEDLGRQ